MHAIHKRQHLHLQHLSYSCEQLHLPRLLFGRWFCRSRGVVKSDLAPHLPSRTVSLSLGDRGESEAPESPSVSCSSFISSPAWRRSAICPAGSWYWFRSHCRSDSFITFRIILLDTRSFFRASSISGQKLYLASHCSKEGSIPVDARCASE